MSHVAIECLRRAEVKFSESKMLSLHGAERWFVVHTLPHQEKRAQIQLQNQRYRTFLPKREKTVRHARKLATVVAPFFPRYTFIILDPEHDQWRPINGTMGVEIGRAHV